MKKIEKKDYKEFLSYAIIFLITFIIIQLFIGIAFIPSGSMEPTLHVGQRYPFFTMSYLLKDPQCGDIIVFDDEGTIYCKRIIGVPGNEILIKDGSIFINGQKLDEPYANGSTYAYKDDYYLVPDGEYFFLGDNRENSHDSRLWYYPFIKKNQILGKIIPFSIRK